MIERLPVRMGDRRAVLHDISPGAVLWLANGGQYQGPCEYVRFIAKKFLIEVRPLGPSGERTWDGDMLVQVDPTSVWITEYVIQEQP